MRGQKAVSNIISSLLLQASIAIVGIILPRLFILNYGSSINGLVSSIKQLMSYLNLVEAGVEASSAISLYGPLSQKNEVKINSILAATRKYYLRSGCLYSFLVACMALSYPFIVQGQVDFTIAAAMVLIIGVTGSADFFLIGKYRVLLIADQRSYVVSVVQTVFTIVNAIAVIILIVLKINVLLVQLTSVFVYVFQIFMFAGYVRRKYSFIDFKANPDFAALDKRWDALIHQTTGLVVFCAPMIIITVFCGLKEVSVYVVYNMIFVAVHQMISSFSNGLTAGFGEVIASRNRSSLINGYANYEYIFFAVMAWAYVNTALLVLPFVELYTKGVHDANYVRPLLGILFVIVGIANNIRVPANTIVNSAGHFRETRKKAVIEAVINLTVSVVMVQFMGINGVLIGALCSYAYRTRDFVLYVSKFILDKPSWPSWRRITRNVVSGLLIYASVQLTIQITINSYWQWLFWAVVAGAFSCFVIVGINWAAEPDMFKETVKRIRSMGIRFSGFAYSK